MDELSSRGGRAPSAEAAAFAGGARVEAGYAAPLEDLLPLAGRLLELARLIPPPEIAELWLFPPLPDVEDSSDFFLLTRYLDTTTRRVYSARLRPENGTPATQVIVEHGTVPADRVPRLVGRLQRRVGQQQTRHVVIDGQLPNWEALLAMASGEGAAA